MGKIIRIGTRDSQLALWQARFVQKRLNDLGYNTTIIPIESKGDIILDKPLHQLGITGVFTKNLDAAMLNEEIDIAVHSMKDVPTVLPKGMVKAAVLKRADYSDILVHKGNLDFLEYDNNMTHIATGSLRRAAFWKNKFKNHKISDLRGNVNTRLQKLKENLWNGAIFAKAALERVNLLNSLDYINLDWMIPAPAQGAIMVCTMEQDIFSKDVCANINDEETKICTQIERDFLQTLEGGCTAPIGALATFDRGNINFRGAILSVDGTLRIDISKTVEYTHGIGRNFAQEVLNKGADKIIKQIKNLKIR